MLSKSSSFWRFLVVFGRLFTEFIHAESFKQKLKDSTRFDSYIGMKLRIPTIIRYNPMAHLSKRGTIRIKSPTRMARMPEIARFIVTIIYFLSITSSTLNFIKQNTLTKCTISINVFQLMYFN